MSSSSHYMISSNPNQNSNQQVKSINATNDFHELSINRYSSSSCSNSGAAGGPVQSSTSQANSNLIHQSSNPAAAASSLSQNQPHFHHRPVSTGGTSSELKNRTDGKIYASKSKIINNRYV